MRRRLVDSAARGLLFLTTLAGCSLLALILTAVVRRGFPSMSIEFLTREARDFGLEGGIFHQIAGTLILTASAGIVSFPIALGSALFQTEFLKSPGWKQALRIATYTLNGAPTILFGLTGYMFFGAFLGMGVSWVTGALVLAVMVLPTVQISVLEAIESIPAHYRETGMALGLTPWAQIRAVVLPQSFYGVITGVLLGLARAAGETAAIMFTATAFSGAGIPRSLAEPVSTLQTHILVLAQEAVNPKAVANAWGAGLALTALVFALMLSALWARSRLRLESHR